MFRSTAARGSQCEKRGRDPVERIAIDTRERYGYGFKGRGIVVERVTLRAGDYAAFIGNGESVAVVERKTMDDFCKSLLDGSLGFAMSELAQCGTSAVAVEGTYAQLLRRGYVNGAWLVNCWCGCKCGTRRCRSCLSKRARSAKHGRSLFLPLQRASERSERR